MKKMFYNIENEAKKVRKYFADMKIMRIFATHSTLNGVHKRLYAAGFFYFPQLQTIGSVPPCGELMLPLPLRWNATGKAEPLLFSAKQTNLSVMHSTEKNCLNGKISTSNTSNSTKTAPAQKARKLNGKEAVNTNGIPAVAEKPKKHYYIVNVRALGHWATDFKSGLYVSRILRALSKEDAIGHLCTWIKANYPMHSILAKDITCDTFNFINPQI